MLEYYIGLFFSLEIEADQMCQKGSWIKSADLTCVNLDV